MLETCPTTRTLVTYMVRGTLIGSNQTAFFRHVYIDPCFIIWKGLIKRSKRSTSRRVSFSFRAPFHQKPTTMASAKQKQKQSKGDAASGEFETYFSQLWGARWKSLSSALSSPTSHCAMLNAFVNDSESCATDILGKEARPVPWSRFVAPLKILEWSSATIGGIYPPPIRDIHSGLMPWYWLDPASLIPPLALLRMQLRGEPASGRVLDMCAAPGGKSLVLAQLLFLLNRSAGASSLISNEIDAKRRSRLLTVLRQYIPQSLLSHDIRVLGKDGTTFAKRSNDSIDEIFDMVLIDAPCSSDRHVAQQAVGRGGVVRSSDWTVQRCKSLAKDQQKLVAAGIKALSVGGCLVYSTCSITDIQNDAVIEKIMEKAGSAVSAVSHGFSEELDACWIALGAERTKYGWIILPDTTGWGPIYWCNLRKNEHTDMKRTKVNKYASEILHTV